MPRNQRLAQAGVLDTERRAVSGVLGQPPPTCVTAEPTSA